MLESHTRLHTCCKREACYVLADSAPSKLPQDAAMAVEWRISLSAEDAACGAVSVLWLPLRAYTFLIRSGGAQASASPLAESALLLLLALLHHAPAPELGPGNPFRQALANMQACACMLCVTSPACCQGAHACVMLDGSSVVCYDGPQAC